MTEFRKVLSDEDIEEVARLACEIWTEHYVTIIGQAQVDYMLGNFQSAAAVADQIAKQYEYYLILDKGRSAGYLGLAPGRTATELLLSKIYVRKELRGQGLGKETLSFMESLCRERGFTTVLLNVNKNNSRAIAWYKQMGFRKVEATIQDIGEGFVMDDFIMKKEISLPRSRGER